MVGKTMKQTNIHIGDPRYGVQRCDGSANVERVKGGREVNQTESEEVQKQKNMNFHGWLGLLEDVFKRQRPMTQLIMM